MRKQKGRFTARTGRLRAQERFAARQRTVWARPDRYDGNEFSHLQLE
jgi:hypothetical protein